MFVIIGMFTMTSTSDNLTAPQFPKWSFGKCSGDVLATNLDKDN